MIKVYLANLGKYNEGELVGLWLDLPATDELINKMYCAIGVGQMVDGEYVHGLEVDGIVYEETAIHDYETDIHGLDIGEYSNLQDLNEQAAAVEEFDEYEKKALGAFLGNGEDFADAVEHVKNGDYTLYSGCSDMEDVAREFCDSCGILEDVPEHLQNYFDYEAYGRDMEIEGTFIYIDGDYIELIY